MGKEESVGSDKAELKKMLKIALQQPVKHGLCSWRGWQGHHPDAQDQAAPGAGEGAEGGGRHQETTGFGTVIIDPDSPKVAKFRS